MDIPTISNWLFVSPGLYNVMVKPEDSKEGFAVMGNVKGHPKFFDNSLMITGMVLSVDAKEMTVTTTDRVYKLEEPSKSFSKFMAAHDLFVSDYVEVCGNDQ